MKENIIDCLYDVINVEVDIQHIINVIKLENKFDELIQYNSKKKYLLQWFIETPFVDIIIDEIEEDEMINFFLFLFNNTSSTICNKYENSNRCHWMAKAIYLRSFGVLWNKIEASPRELVQKDIYGNTPLHLALIHNNFGAFICFRNTPCWIRNNKNKSILDIYVKRYNYSLAINYYSDFIHQIKNKFSLPKMIVKKIKKYLYVNKI